MSSVVAKIKSQRSEPQNSPNEIRVAYPYFHEKRTKNAAGIPYVFGADHPKAGQPNPRYSATFMFPKTAADPTQCKNYQFLWGLAVEAARKMWPTNVDAAGNWVWPAGAALPINDGDVPFASKPKPGQPMQSPEEAAKKNAWRNGYWIVEAENFLDPGPRVAKPVNGVATELPAKTINGVVQYKGGDWGYVNLHAYAYQNKTFGVNFGFDGFCFTRSGEAIGNSGPRSATQMFGGVAQSIPQSMPGQVAGTAAAAPPNVGAGPAPGYAPLPPAAPVAPVAPQVQAPPMPPAAPAAAPPMPPAAPAAAGGPPMPPGLPPLPR